MTPTTAAAAAATAAEDEEIYAAMEKRATPRLPSATAATYYSEPPQPHGSKVAAFAGLGS